jgi:hypothetical protein
VAEPAPAAPAAPAPRLHRGELISATSALVLLADMFLLKWYGVVGVPGPFAARSAVSTAENAWNGLAVVRWLMLLTIGVTLGSVVLHATQRAHGTKTDTSGLITALGTMIAALLVYRVLIDLPSPSQVVDQKIGAYLGLLAAVCLAFGGYESMREERARARRALRRAKSRARVASGAGPR